MKKVVQVALFVAFASLLFAAPDAFAIDDCKVCKGRTGEGGSVYIFCDRPSPGGWGTRYCFVEDTGGYGAYCHTEGDWCCVDGPMY